MPGAECRGLESLEQRTLFSLVPTADAFEPDDVIAQATTLNVNSTAQVHSIHHALDKDWFRFTITQESDVTIEAHAPSGGTIKMSLYDIDERQIEWGYNSAWDQYQRLTRAGDEALIAATYLVKVEDLGSNGTIDRYDIRVTAKPATKRDLYEDDNDRATARPIPPNGTAQTRTIHDRFDVDWLTFSLVQKSGIIVETDGDDGGDTRITLYSANRYVPIAEDDDGGRISHDDGDNRNRYGYSRIERGGDQALAAGDYLIKVESNNTIERFNYDGIVPRYTIRVIASEPQDSTPRVVIEDIPDLPTNRNTVQLRRFDSPGQPIDPNLPTAVVIHGRRGSFEDTAIQNLAKAIADAAIPEVKQVLLLDWSEAAHAESVWDYTGEEYIDNVAVWAATQLATRRFDVSKLLLVGHSWGAGVAYETARLFGKKVGGIVAIDPAQDVPLGYDMDALNFKSIAQRSWAFYAGDRDLGGNIAGNEKTPTSAHYAFVVDGRNHGNIVSFISPLLGAGPLADDVSQLFRLSAFFDNNTWNHLVQDQFKYDGTRLASGNTNQAAYEGVIRTHKSRPEPVGFTYVHQDQGELTLAAAGRTLQTAALITIPNATPRVVLQSSVGPDNPTDYYTFKLNTTTRVTILLSGLSDDANLTLFNVLTGKRRKLKYEPLTNSTNAGTANERIKGRLAKGRYVVGVETAGLGTTTYVLTARKAKTKARVRVIDTIANLAPNSICHRCHAIRVTGATAVTSPVTRRFQES